MIKEVNKDKLEVLAVLLHSELNLTFKYEEISKISSNC